METGTGADLLKSPREWQASISTGAHTEGVPADHWHIGSNLQKILQAAGENNRQRSSTGQTALASWQRSRETVVWPLPRRESDLLSDSEAKQRLKQHAGKVCTQCFPRETLGCAEGRMKTTQWPEK